MSPSKDRTPRIVVNGEDRPLASGSTVLSLLGELDLDPRTVAVEHNGTVLKRDAFGATPLEDGDRLEIVRFVQGGAGSRHRPVAAAARG